MKRLVLAAALALALGLGFMFIDIGMNAGLTPQSFLDWLEESIAPAATQALFSVGNLTDLGDLNAVEEPPLYVGFDVQVSGYDFITSSILDGVRAQKEGIEIPVVLPDASDEEITAYLLHQVELAIDVIRRDVPEVFWISLGSYVIEWSGDRESGSGNLIVYIGYCNSAEEVDAKTTQMEQVIDGILAEAPTEAAEAAAFFHDWIVLNTTYATDLAVSDISMHGYEYGFNVDGVFLRGRAVCEGYSKAFKMLCDRAGIPCESVFGEANGENHSWNYVCLDGEWYLVDATWDDPVGSDSRLLHYYLLKGRSSEVDGRVVGEIYKNDYAQYPSLAEYGYGEDAA